MDETKYGKYIITGYGNPKQKNTWARSLKRFEIREYETYILAEVEV